MEELPIYTHVDCKPRHCATAQIQCRPSLDPLSDSSPDAPHGAESASPKKLISQLLFASQAISYNNTKTDASDDCCLASLARLSHTATPHTITTAA